LTSGAAIRRLRTDETTGLRRMLLLMLLFAQVASAVEDRRVNVKPSHHGERGFLNPGYPWRQPPISVTGPFFLRRFATSLLGARSSRLERVPNDGAELRENALGSVPTVTWVGHSTLLVQMGHVSFLTDPIWSDTASPLPVGPKRYVEPGLRIEDLPRIDFVLISHNHYDHMDLATLRRLAERGTRFFVPLGNAHTLSSAGIGPVEELDWWDAKSVGQVEIFCVPARHWSRRGANDLNKSLWSGWVVTAPDRKFYFAGDTGVFTGFDEIGGRLGPFDLAALPIGAYSPTEMMAPSHLAPEEAIAAAAPLRAQHTVAVHFGTFDLSDEPLEEPPHRFLEASRKAQRGPERDWVLKVGETRLW
jgi:N-acyl-phosphatidylethanolamine-hydrolysing phospholipase D